MEAEASSSLEGVVEILIQIEELLKESEFEVSSDRYGCSVQYLNSVRILLSNRLLDHLRSAETVQEKLAIIDKAHEQWNKLDLSPFRWLSPYHRLGMLFIFSGGKLIFILIGMFVVVHRGLIGVQRIVNALEAFIPPSQEEYENRVNTLSHW